MAFTISELAKLALGVYENPPKDEGPWKYVAHYGKLGSQGFLAALFKSEENRHVLALRGTDDGWDVIDDAGIMAGEITSQMLLAQTALKSARSETRTTKRLVLTGHSLGGGLAALLAVDSGLHCVTFNAPGTARSYGQLFASNYPMPLVQQMLAVTAPMVADTSRIINVRASFDVVSVGTGPRLGRVKTIPVRGCEVLPEHFQARMQPALREYQGRGKVAPSTQVAAVVDRAAKFAVCQHSMARMASELSYQPDYNRDLGW